MEERDAGSAAEFQARGRLGLRDPAFSGRLELPSAREEWASLSYLAPLAKASSGPCFGRRFGGSDRIVYIDGETTGLRRDGDRFGVIGLLYRDEQSWCCEQWTLRRLSCEAAFLEAVVSRLAALSPKAVVSYNGASFDLPLFRKRLARVASRIPAETKARLSGLLDRDGSLWLVDLLYVARRLWRGRLPDCRLQTLERRVLGLYRVDDLPGREVPQVYWRWLLEPEDPGHREQMNRLRLHNAVDLLVLPALVQHLAQALVHPSGAEDARRSLCHFESGRAPQIWLGAMKIWLGDAEASTARNWVPAKGESWPSKSRLRRWFVYLRKLGERVGPGGPDLRPDLRPDLGLGLGLDRSLDLGSGLGPDLGLNPGPGLRLDLEPGPKRGTRPDPGSSSARGSESPPPRGQIPGWSKQEIHALARLFLRRVPPEVLGPSWWLSRAKAMGWGERLPLRQWAFGCRQLDLADAAGGLPLVGRLGDPQGSRGAASCLGPACSSAYGSCRGSGDEVHRGSSRTSRTSRTSPCDSHRDCPRNSHSDSHRNSHRNSDRSRTPSGGQIPLFARGFDAEERSSERHRSELGGLGARGFNAHAASRPRGAISARRRRRDPQPSPEQLGLLCALGSRRLAC